MEFIGVRLLGRCFLPCKIKELGTNHYEFEFYYRSNRGGLKQRERVELKLSSTKSAQLSISSNGALPLKVVQVSENIHSLKGLKNLDLLKPNKYFLKHYSCNLLCQRGNLEIPLLITHSQGVIQGGIKLYPSILNHQEYLVVEVENVQLVQRSEGVSHSTSMVREVGL